MLLDRHENVKMPSHTFLTGGYLCYYPPICFPGADMKSNQPKSVLISGASTGIGRDCALDLDRRGWIVFAGVRKEQDGDTLKAKASERLQPVMLDVADSDQILEAAMSVNDVVGEDGLSALVNNAGIAIGGPVEFIPRDEWRLQFEVNLFGSVELTQACLPLLRTGQGRIVNISSIAGRSAMPFTAPYCASKHALEALSDSLRLELWRWKIPVSLIEPGAIKTPIWDKAQERTDDFRDNSPEELMDLYGDALSEFNRVIANAAQNSIPVEAVTRAIRKALTARRPRHRYVVGNDARQRLILNMLPTRWQDSILARLLKLKQD